MNPAIVIAVAATIACMLGVFLLLTKGTQATNPTAPTAEATTQAAKPLAEAQPAPEPTGGGTPYTKEYYGVRIHLTLPPDSSVSTETDEAVEEGGHMLTQEVHFPDLPQYETTSLRLLISDAYVGKEETEKFVNSLPGVRECEGTTIRKEKGVISVTDPCPDPSYPLMASFYRRRPRGFVWLVFKGRPEQFHDIESTFTMQ